MFKNTVKNRNSNYCLQGPGRSGVSLNQEHKWWSQPWMWRGCENKNVVGHFGPRRQSVTLFYGLAELCPHLYFTVVIVAFLPDELEPCATGSGVYYLFTNESGAWNIVHA